MAVHKVTIIATMKIINVKLSRSIKLSFCELCESGMAVVDRTGNEFCLVDVGNFDGNG